MLANLFYCTFVFTFLWSCFGRDFFFCTGSYWIWVIFNRSISPIYGILTGLSRPGSNGNKDLQNWILTGLSRQVWVGNKDLQNWILTIRCRLMSYPGNTPFLVGGTPLQCMWSAYSKDDISLFPRTQNFSLFNYSIQWVKSPSRNG